MELLEKIRRIKGEDLAAGGMNLMKYVWYLLCDYESEKPKFDSFDSYIEARFSALDGKRGG